MSLEEDSVLTMGSFFVGTPLHDYLQKPIWWYKYKGPSLIICSWLQERCSVFVEFAEVENLHDSTAQRASLSPARTREG